VTIHNCIERMQGREEGKMALMKFLSISLLSIGLSFLMPLLNAVASVETDVSERIIEIKQISFPLLLMSAAILLYSIIRLFKYRRVIEKKSEELRESEERYALSARGANDGLWDWNLRTQEIFFSLRWKSMLGYDDEEIGNKPDDWFTLVHPDDIENLKNAIAAHLKEPNAHLENEYRIKQKDGTYLWMLCRGLAVKDAEGKAVRMAGSQTDITNRKQMEEQLIYDAFHDGLTGLPNRALFMDRLNVSFARKKRRKDYQFAVLFMDLDRFKNINDSFGHLFGNQLLTEVAKRLNNSLRLGDTFARFGGDEFVILLLQTGTEEARAVISRIQENLLNAMAERGFSVTCSFGVVTFSTMPRSIDEAIRASDDLMYCAKQQGKNRTIFAVHDAATPPGVVV